MDNNNENCVDLGKVSNLINAMCDAAIAERANYLEVMQAAKSVYFAAREMTAKNIPEVLNEVDKMSKEKITLRNWDELGV